MIKWITLLFCMSMSMMLCAQVTIHGTVKNQSGAPLVNASIIISPVGSNKVIAFKMTDGKGAFTIPLQSGLDSVQVKLNLLNHETEIKTIVNQTQEIHFIAKEKATVLEEVFVKDPMMFRKGDTIVHDVEQFANKNDRTLADVIKRMPGLEIDESGKIKYQGKDVNQFTVEGKDLMQGRYGIIPNAIPHKDVGKLEVIENNQPIKILKDKVPSENAGINIKLKKNVTWTGSGAAALGLSPFLWNLKLTPMLFAKKRQALFNLKSNNTGEDIISENGNFISLSGFMGQSQDNSTGDFLRPSSVSPPASIPQSRYWFNRSHAIGANFLEGLKHDWEIKANLLYTYHELDLKGASNTSIANLNTDGTVLNTLNYTRTSDLNDIAQKAKATLSLNKNAKANFFKNDLIFSIDRSNSRSILQLDSIPVYQRTHANGFSIQNSLSTLFPLGKQSGYLINLQSYINYAHDPEWYRVDSLKALRFADADMQSALSLKQLKRSGSFNTTNTVSMAFSGKALTIVPAIRFLYADELLNTDLELTQTTGKIQLMEVPWLNRLRLDNFNTQVSVGINIKKENIRLSLNLPLSNNIIHVKDEENFFKRDLNKWLFQPSLFAELSVKKFTFSATAARVNRFSSLTSIYPGYVFSALNINAYQSPIEEAAFTRAGSRVAYKNLLHNIDANWGYSYTHNNSNIMLSRQIADNGQQVSTAILQNNSGAAHTLFLNFSKYMKKAATNLVTGYSYTRSTTMNLLNNNLFTAINHNQNASLKLENSSLSWLIAGYTIAYGYSKRIDRGTNNLTHTLSQGAKLSFYTSEKSAFNISGDWNRYTIAQQQFNNQFADASYRHTVGKRNIDLELKWVNIFNTKEYEQVLINTIQTNITRFTLRPSQLLMSVRMNLR
jgi:hypothetical protein